MREFQITLSEEQHETLTELLIRTLKAKRVEEHRTKTISYRDRVLREEHVLEQILHKLGAMSPELMES